MNNKIKLLRRQTIELMIEECLDITENAPARSTLLYMSLDERRAFNELLNEMVSIVSTIEKTISIHSFIRKYTSVSYDIIYRMFLKTEVTTCRKSSLLKFIDDCEKVADEKLGTIEELKKANDGKGTLVVQ